MAHPNPKQIEYMKAHASDDKRTGFIVMNAVFLAMACGAVGLRFLARHRIGTKIGWDDVLIVFALIFLGGHAISLFVAVHFGMGRHAIFVTDVKGLAVSAIIAQAFYNSSIPAIKLSILALYIRIFRRTAGWFTPVIYLTAFFVFSYSLAQFFVYLLRCVPIASLWDPRLEASATCLNFRTAIIVTGIINILTDWWILGLPVPVVMGLKMERRTKWSLLGLFLWGGLVCIVSVIRLFYAKNVNTVDPSWDYVPIAQISTVETASGILAACMPTYRPLFSFLGSGIGSLFSSQYRNKSSGHSAPGSDFAYNLDVVGQSSGGSADPYRTAHKHKRNSKIGIPFMHPGSRRKSKSGMGMGLSGTGDSATRSTIIPAHSHSATGSGNFESMHRTDSEERILGREWEVSAGSKTSNEIDADLGVQVSRGSKGWEGLGEGGRERGIVVTKTIRTEVGEVEVPRL